jgi:hypothetical protein
MDSERCCQKILDNTGFHYIQCSRKGVVECDGKRYCRQHHPDAVKARRKKANDKYNMAVLIKRRNALALSIGDVLITAGYDTIEKAVALVKSAQETDEQAQHQKENPDEQAHT